MKLVAIGAACRVRYCSYCSNSAPPTLFGGAVVPNSRLFGDGAPLAAPGLKQETT